MAVDLILPAHVGCYSLIVVLPPLTPSPLTPSIPPSYLLHRTSRCNKRCNSPTLSRLCKRVIAGQQVSHNSFVRCCVFSFLTQVCPTT